VNYSFNRIPCVLILVVWQNQAKTNFVWRLFW